MPQLMFGALLHPFGGEVSSENVTGGQPPGCGPNTRAIHIARLWREGDFFFCPLRAGTMDDCDRGCRATRSPPATLWQPFRLTTASVLVAVVVLRRLSS